LRIFPVISHVYFFPQGFDFPRRMDPPLPLDPAFHGRPPPFSFLSPPPKVRKGPLFHPAPAPLPSHEISHSSHIDKFCFTPSAPLVLRCCSLRRMMPPPFSVIYKNHLLFDVDTSLNCTRDLQPQLPLSRVCPLQSESTRSSCPPLQSG